MTGIFIMEVSQMLSGLSFYFILRGVKSTFSRNLKAIYIVSSQFLSEINDFVAQLCTNKLEEILIIGWVGP